MLMHVTVAEMQYRLDAEYRDRELARMISIRDRRESIAADAAAAAGTWRRPAPARTRAGWARPIGLQSCCPPVGVPA